MTYIKLYTLDKLSDTFIAHKLDIGAYKGAYKIFTVSFDNITGCIYRELKHSDR